MSARGRVLGGGVSGRTHRSAPTRWGKISAAHKTILCGSLCHGAGRSPPPTGGAGVDRRRGEVTPPYGSSAGGAQRRADVGIGPYALRGDERAARRGRRALRVVAESRRDCPGQRRTAKRLRQRVRRNGWESRQRSPQKCPATPDNPSVGLWPRAPFAQGSLRGGGYGLPRRPCGPPRNDNGFLSFRGAGRCGNPSFLRWTGIRAAEVVGPYGKPNQPPKPAGAQ